ncbi:GGDEF domain-containing protein [Methylobacillus gramineus]|uniref:GGDEF domain-containing protein n=1 Tax=Methylobacillus gramineus TaxID=755169 RepID=UPI001CFFA02B|nr:GGDEF domain-containing protein [Methylobacillus gramineus]MCB5184029.1 GGDEF domain-containing protein [Methylobacillus gramineus]
MDSLWNSYTANISYAISQLCIAIIMGGLYFLAPSERSTRYWAIAGLLSILGSSLTALRVSQFGYLPLITGSTIMIAAMTAKWWGTQAFFGKAPNRIGWYLILGFFIVFSMLIMSSNSQAYRTLLFSVLLAVLMLLNVYEVLIARKLKLSFANSLVVIAFTLGSADFIMRGFMALEGKIDLSPQSHDPINVFGLYLIPMWCNLLGSLGLLLMYFESIIRAKEHLATHDELTKLYNRRALVTLGQREVDIAHRYQKAISVFMLDIDHFKQINDTYGHEAGDVVLRNIAQVISAACRNTDIVGRYGGEEFCIICPNTGLAEASALGERLLEATRALHHAECDQRQITSSLGLYSWDPQTDLGTGWETMLRRADTALYAAKANGRNRMLKYQTEDDNPQVNKISLSN